MDEKQMTKNIADLTQITFDCIASQKIKGCVQLMHIAARMLPDKELAQVNIEMVTIMRDYMIGKPGSEKVLKDLERLITTSNEIIEKSK